MAQTHDTNGRPYAKLKELKAGDFIETDRGFDCMKVLKKRRVRADADGDLYVVCAAGHHALDGQADDGVHCVGIYKPGA